MTEYFKLLEAQANLDHNVYSIKDITIQLALKAGYQRGPYKFKNGNVRERTQYTKKFDDVLTAKWLCFYKKLFISKLYRHPELKEYHVDIINRTFEMVMKSINLDKLTTDKIIHKYVNLALSNRIGDVLYIMGSNKRLQDNQLNNSKN